MSNRRRGPRSAEERRNISQGVEGYWKGKGKSRSQKSEVSATIKPDMSKLIIGAGLAAGTIGAIRRGNAKSLKKAVSGFNPEKVGAEMVRGGAKEVNSAVKNFIGDSVRNVKGAPSAFMGNVRKGMGTPNPSPALNNAARTVGKVSGKAKGAVTGQLNAVRQTPSNTASAFKQGMETPTSKDSTIMKIAGALGKARAKAEGAVRKRRGS